MTVNFKVNGQISYNSNTGLMTGDTYKSREWIKENFKTAKWDKENKAWEIDLNEFNEQMEECKAYYSRFITSTELDEEIENEVKEVVNIEEKEVLRNDLINTNDGYIYRTIYKDGTSKDIYCG